MPRRAPSHSPAAGTAIGMELSSDFFHRGRGISGRQEEEEARLCGRAKSEETDAVQSESPSRLHTLAGPARIDRAGVAFFLPGCTPSASCGSSNL